MVTMLYVAVDPTTWEATVVPSAAAPPGPGERRILPGGTRRPPGRPELEPPVRGFDPWLRPGSVLVLFTDGLVDRRDVAVEEGLDRLPHVAGELVDRDRDIEEVCGSLLLSLVPEDASDDVAVLVARLDPVGDRLSLRIPADPSKLASIRRNVTLADGARRLRGRRRGHRARELGGVRERDRARVRPAEDRSTSTSRSTEVSSRSW